MIDVNALFFFLFNKPIGSIWLNAEDILLMLRQDPEVAHLAGVYLKWLILGLPAFGFNNVSRYSSAYFSLPRLISPNLIGRRYFQSQGLLVEFT